jgi:hypothetical protein
MTTHVLQRAFALMASIVLVPGLSAATAAAGDLFEMSLPSVPWNDGERIVGYRIQIQGARIVTVRDVQLDWHVVIDNTDPTDRRVDASAAHGAGSLDRDRDRSFFQRFVTIEMQQGGPFDLPFGVTGEVWFTTDFVKIRTMHLDKTSVELRQISPP